MNNSDSEMIWIDEQGNEVAFEDRDDEFQHPVSEEEDEHPESMEEEEHVLRTRSRRTSLPYDHTNHFPET